MAEYYSAELSQKVRRGQEESRKKGNYTGGTIPYGYRAVGDRKNGKKLVIQEDEAEVVRQIFQDYVAGKPMQTIYQELNEKGILCKGKPFARSTVYTFITNEKYAGVYRHKGVEYENTYPAIISKDMFYMIKARLDFNRFGKHKRDVVYLLRKKVVCGYCGKPVTSEAGTTRTGEVMRYYKCKGRKKDMGCELLPIRKETLENFVVDITLSALQSSDTIDNIADMILKENEKQVVNTSVINILTQQKEETQKAISNLLRAIEQGIFNASTKERLDELERQRDELTAKIIAEQSRNNLQIKKGDITRYIKSAIKKEPLAMITLLIQKIVLYNDKIEIYYNYCENKGPDDEHRAFSFYTTQQDIVIYQNAGHPAVTKYTVICYI